jgi:serine phosphatase RsbU (regulator of sigma subunit)
VERELILEPGDLLLLYTDGVTDACNLAQEEFGLQRLRNLVATCGELGAQETLDCINGAVSRFVGDAPATDDITMVVIRRN